MKKFYSIILIFYIISYSSFGDNGISISLARISDTRFCFIPMTGDALGKKTMVSFSILLRNEGNKKIGIYSENFSLGYFAWYLELKDRGKIIKIKKRSKIFYRNLPDWSIVFPGEALVIPFKISDWENIDFFKKKSVQLRVIFSQRENPESNRMFQNKIYKKYSNLIFKGTVKSQWYSLKIENGHVVGINNS